MKKILIISDTHGALRAVDGMIPFLRENDYLIHLGDGAGDLRVLWDLFPERIYQCAGNCDGISPAPEQDVLEVEGVRIFYCHGHQYGVKDDLQALANAAKKRDCQIALYGHTHKPNATEIDGVTLLNPGALRYPVYEGGPYCYLIVYGDKFTYVHRGEGIR
ncbi:MAG: metallophosphoesterase [Clostridia bacterium]|nr:metallophosphoesterase [Clostridia bacterium]